MKQRLFEDSSTIYDVDRQMSGMGGEVATQGPITVNSQLKAPDDKKDNILFPVDAIEKSMSDAFVSISNVHQLTQIANNNPTLASSKIVELQSILKDMAKLLVDFDEVLAKIKGND